LGLNDRAIFLSARSDVADVMSAADAFIMSSRSEGLPMVLLEAMAAGVPCVATAVGGIPNLFGSERGLLVPPQDSLKLAEAMASIARSTELRRSLVIKALENLQKNYEIKPIVDRYLSLLGLPLRAPQSATSEGA